MSDNSIGAILNNLKDLGFTEYEGKVYMSLLNEHPLRLIVYQRIPASPIQESMILQDV